MAFETLSLGLTLTLPTNGTRNWGTTLKNTTWTRISQHRHTGSGDGNQIPTGGIADGAITSAKLATNLAIFKQASTVTPSGTTATLDFDNGTIQTLDLGSATGDVTITLSNPETGGLYLVYIIQGATPRALTWPASVKWPQGQSIILSQGNDEKDFVLMQYDGTDYNVLDWDLDIS